MKLLDLTDRAVTDTGEVALGDRSLAKLAMDGHKLGGLLAMDSQEVRKYNRLSADAIRIFVEDGTFAGVPKTGLEWTTPDPWRQMDVAERCCSRLIELGLDSDPRYIARLDDELGKLMERDMIPVIRHACYLVDDFTARKVVWGVGRGSSCASLVLFLVGLNLVDPIRFDIPLDEFLRPDDL